MKESFFLSRLVVFHLTGAPVGKLSEHIPVVVACWNESVRGRKAADVPSAWLSILMEHRDADTITVWCDNCTGQNKNYTLYSVLVQLINSPEIAARKITLKYFEPGE